MSTITQVQPLSPTNLPEASVTLAAAFYDDPHLCFLLPQKETRDRWLQLLMGAGLRQVLPESYVYTTAGEGVPGVIGLVPPGRYPLPFWRNLRFIISLTWQPPPFGLPLRFRIRAFQTMGVVERLHPQQPHWYVSVLGVHPEHQGTGLGRALLEPALARADRDRLPTYLETTKESNLSFYRHFGFEIKDEVEAPGGSPPVWTMLRPPAG